MLFRKENSPRAAIALMDEPEAASGHDTSAEDDALVSWPDAVVALPEMLPEGSLSVLVS